ncbi:PIN domain-containing protein [Streptomyces sp. NPDC087317]|uniref:PIN domain-containing protein n=1 Tax=Streptomyces sp. NPDC087317 TaxID=3365784 RepID=UPI00380BD64B
MLQRLANEAGNLRGPSPGLDETGRLLRYLEWTTEAARSLRFQVSDGDIECLVLTPGYRALLAASGSIKGARLINGLVDAELETCVRVFEAAAKALQALIERWPLTERFVVADSSFYIHNPVRLEDVDLHQILSLRSSENLRLLFPITVVDELDRLKESGKERPRWRASSTLSVLDRILAGRTAGNWRTGRFLAEDGDIRGDVTLEIVLDPPGHVRLPVVDDEIIDRAVAVQALAGRPVRLLTCDTGQHTRGCAAGLEVTKIPAKDPGPEPDWENKAPGLRAQRRAAQQAKATSTTDG